MISQSKKVKEQIEVYRRLQKTERLYCGLTILPFDALAALEYQQIKKRYPRLGTMDQKIAAIVLVTGGTLLSRNLQDFRPVAGLKVEDWTKE